MVQLGALLWTPLWDASSVPRPLPLTPPSKNFSNSVLTERTTEWEAVAGAVSEAIDMWQYHRQGPYYIAFPYSICTVCPRQKCVREASD